MCSDSVIEVSDLGKRFEIFDKPRDRLKQMLVPRLQRALGLTPAQYFEEFWAVRSVSFSVKPGETVGVIGRNGSGKSTLLQMLCGTLTPTKGTVQVRGRVAALLELGSGFNPEFTGKENVYMNAAVLGLSREQIDERFADIVSFADIGSFINQPTKTYSSGMMVRLAFGVIAHVDADVLVIDEALAVGDAFFTQKCMRFLRKFMEHGTVLFVSHDTSAVRDLCSRALWMDNGRLLMDGSPREVSESYLEAFYESQQGRSGLDVKEVKRPEKAKVTEVEDQRNRFINSSNLRNDIRVFSFEPDSAAFGVGKAKITNVLFVSDDGAALSWIVGGENVVLRVEGITEVDLVRPIIGFFVKDRLGQEVFGDNTYLTYHDAPVRCAAGSEFQASFCFQMPRLARGDYAVTVAIADGDQQEHIQHHWIHDALVFRSESSHVVSGKVGIPMSKIELKVHDE
jgi:lipopolysaccharide transport system ATP-binding protein